MKLQIATCIHNYVFGRFYMKKLYKILEILILGAHVVTQKRFIYVYGMSKSRILALTLTYKTHNNTYIYTRRR